MPYISVPLIVPFYPPEGASVEASVYRMLYPIDQIPTIRAQVNRWKRLRVFCRTSTTSADRAGKLRLPIWCSLLRSSRKRMSFDNRFPIHSLKTKNLLPGNLSSASILISRMLVAKRVLSLIHRAEQLQCSTERALRLVSFNV